MPARSVKKKQALVRVEPIGPVIRVFVGSE